MRIGPREATLYILKTRESILGPHHERTFSRSRWAASAERERLQDREMPRAGRFDGVDRKRADVCVVDCELWRSARLRTGLSR